MPLIKNAFVNALKQSSIHGLPFLLRTERLCIKLIWSVAFIAMIFLCFNYIRATFKEYIEYKTISNIKIITNQISLTFPAITFCNMNKNNMTIKEMLKKCDFNKRPCTDEDFTETLAFSNGWGTCYSYNVHINSTNITRRLMENKFSGYETGLNMQLFLGLPSDSNSDQNGLWMFIHNNYELPLKNQALEITTGLKTNLIIKKEKSIKLPDPYSECQTDETIRQKITKELNSYLTANNRTYKQSCCFLECLTIELSRMCNNCSIEYEMIEKNCLMSERNCTEHFFAFHWEKLFDNKCKRQCPLECEMESFKYTTTYSNFPSMQYYRKNNQNISTEYFEYKYSMLSLSIYYESISVTEISETKKYSFPSLVSNVGGTLGVCVGASFLSFIEALDFLYELVVILLKKN